jgi:hypothetical protein
MGDIKQRTTTYEQTPSGTKTGFFQSFIPEKIPTWHAGNAEVVEEANGCFKVIHRDRPSGLASGGGGSGKTACAAFTIVTGLDSANGPTDERRSPNRATDAATFYMTQKGQMTSDFGLSKGATIGSNQLYRSGAALKADRSAIVGREEIKLVTGKMRLSSGKEKLAQGGSFSGGGTIQLIAGNYTGDAKLGSVANMGASSSKGKIKTLQPIPKGDNLKELLDSIIGNLNSLNGQLLDNRRSIIELGTAFNSHMHIGACAVGPTLTSPSPMIGLTIQTVINQFTKISDNIAFSANQAVEKLNFLDPNFANHINSKNVSTT